jgi:thymidylate synthase ThyX
MVVKLIESPTQKDWCEVKRRALVTIGKEMVKEPDFEWKRKMLAARHSPIRRLHFSFYIECPYWVSVHLCRHVHAQPYVKSQRNDRQSDYDRTKAPQDATVCMIWDMNAEELMIIANKRLCKQASAETREVVQMMCDLVVEALPEFKYELVPNCVRNGGECYEFISCKGEIKCK